MQTDPKFTERAGFDSYDPYSYVASNPVNFRDPTGERWTWDALAKPVRIALQNANNTLQRIAKGKKYNDRNDAFSVGTRKIGEAGTFLRKIGQHPTYFIGALIGAIDYTLSFIGGRNPSIIYKNGSFGIKNSFFASDGSFSYLGVAYIEKGDSKETIRHEFGHNTQYFNKGSGLNDLWEGCGLACEIEADFYAGTTNYESTLLVLSKFLNRQQMDNVLIWNALTTNGIDQFLNILLLNSTDQFRNDYLTYVEFLTELKNKGGFY